MLIEKFTKLRLKDSLLERFQLNLEKFFFQVYDNPFLKGQLIEGVELTSTAKSITHALGRVPIGFLVLDKNAGASIYRTDSDREQIKLAASSNCTAKLWVF